MTIIKIMKNFFLKTDKLLHILATTFIVLISTVIFKLLGCGIESVAYGWGIAFVAGMGKEIYDESKNKSSEEKDWIADLIGATTTAVCLLLLLL